VAKGVSKPAIASNQKIKGVKKMAKNNRRTTVSVASSAKSAATEFNPDYTYIKRDLGRIGVLAGSFFVILIVLSFFIK
jgi:hypothetical protein